MEIQEGSRQSTGGVAYQLVKASPEEVLSALQNVDTLPQALPKTKSAKLVGLQDKVAYIELVQGTKVAEATYTIQLVRTSDRELRFWLDSTRPHDIDNVWGYFRAEPFGNGRTLVTVAVALDLGPGVVRMLFEDRVQQVILDAPRHIRDFVEPRAFAAY
jgi:carbon monoxide dehydrogenase subunit G